MKKGMIVIFVLIVALLAGLSVSAAAANEPVIMSFRSEADLGKNASLYQHANPVTESGNRVFNETEKALIQYRFVRALSQSETAKKLGVSQMFVSRMERKLLLKLKQRLKDSV